MSDSINYRPAIRNALRSLRVDRSDDVALSVLSSSREHVRCSIDRFAVKHHLTRYTLAIGYGFSSSVDLWHKESTSIVVERFNAILNGVLNDAAVEPETSEMES